MKKWCWNDRRRSHHTDLQMQKFYNKCNGSLWLSQASKSWLSSLCSMLSKVGMTVSI